MSVSVYFCGLNTWHIKILHHIDVKIIKKKSNIAINDSHYMICYIAHSGREQPEI